MKIYHKKNFSEDILLTGLGLLLLVTMLLRQCFRPKSVLICTAALLLGLGLLFRSLSRQCARADRLEQQRSGLLHRAERPAGPLSAQCGRRGAAFQ